MSSINFNNTDDTTLNFGAPTAAHQLTAILNLGCPDSRQWYQANRAGIFQAVQTGQLQLHLKFWNKPVADLAKGNIANNLIDYAQPAQALTFIDAVFAQQEALNAAPDVKHYIETKFQLSASLDTSTAAVQVAREVAANAIISLPTIIFDGTRYFGATLVPVTQLL